MNSQQCKMPYLYQSLLDIIKQTNWLGTEVQITGKAEYDKRRLTGFAAQALGEHTAKKRIELGIQWIKCRL